MSKIGYARVSTTDQSLDLQVVKLEEAGCDKVFTDMASASNTKRDGFQALLSYLRAGDTLIVTRVDRIARSVLDLQTLVKHLKSNDIQLQALEQPISTESASGKAFLDMLAVFAEFELNIRKERQLEGIAAAKKAGKYKGRKPISNQIRSKAQQLYKLEHSISSISRQLSLSRTTIYKLVKKNIG
ncbi:MULTISPECIES: recombinase family protein [unclassified Pseudoalteromonas]|uniref:recombinase family protein n=1 Tax=unclassified Pseudoalteromonas TaxID=194690 RepID=UPI00083DBF93|nr:MULTISPECIES: recombinase family protein [unclassified Pseudoalteromonas]MCG7540456.1 recombinase family protein [Pseudoalteromonas sp. OF7H-1]ODB44943.1 DNA invertase [Pseudoalteromonas sp. BMB]